MAERISKAYQDAVASSLLAGASVIIGDKNGSTLYSGSFGKASLKQGRDDGFSTQTVCAIASMSKLVTAVAVLQCVEKDLIDLDQDVRPLVPDMWTYGIITAFDQDSNTASFEADATPITLRMLLSHTSGFEYEALNPLLAEWRLSRNEGLATGPTLHHQAVLPRVFRPGTGWAYGQGYDWAGKIIEVVMGMTLETYMQEHIWTPLGIQDATFFPTQKPGISSRLADISTLSDLGEPPAVDAPLFKMLQDYTDCFGGAGIYACAKDYYTFLSAVFCRDARLLSAASYTQLFCPQLDEAAERAFEKYIALSPFHTQILSLGVPRNIRRSWSFAGVVFLDGQPGRFEKGTHMWCGLTSPLWFMDHEAGICGTALCQNLPSMAPKVVAVHEEMQRGAMEFVNERIEESELYSAQEPRRLKVNRLHL
ncbi:hypothetical protein CDD81_6437 [Ophiocordyceps australis]|uniref:Beta-lactamase-related domain-containing protein n=1 Tax=Ophiocordyceps australis TaxID=1399860 RepID=A0A2C5YGI9_9HYPO|nr:hypothetical protein CDD81_6437 [Ophiocordyceps australis]